MEVVSTLKLSDIQFMVMDFENKHHLLIYRQKKTKIKNSCYKIWPLLNWINWYHQQNFTAYQIDHQSKVKVLTITKHIILSWFNISFENLV